MRWQRHNFLGRLIELFQTAAVNALHCNVAISKVPQLQPGQKQSTNMAEPEEIEAENYSSIHKRGVKHLLLSVEQDMPNSLNKYPVSISTGRHRVAASPMEASHLLGTNKGSGERLTLVSVLWTSSLQQWR